MGTACIPRLRYPHTQACGQLHGITCFKCNSGFHLEGNECVEDVVLCDDGYWNDDGDCTECLVDKCKECKEPDGACCSECMDGYELKDNECKPVDCGPGKWNDDGVCRRCKVDACEVSREQGTSFCQLCVTLCAQVLLRNMQPYSGWFGMSPLVNCSVFHNGLQHFPSFSALPSIHAF